MKRRFLEQCALAAFAGLLCVGTAQAQSDSVFRHLDRNGDGQITRAEAREATAARFARMDTDGNGTISRDENRSERRVRRFQGMDSNNDGGVTLSEMRAAVTERVRKRFARLDADGNGMITEAEVRNGKRRIHRPLTLQDLDARVMRMIDRADQNRDGVITPDEATAMRPDGPRE